MLKKYLVVVFAIFLGTVVLPVALMAQPPKGAGPAPKCEKCYRGPDGKIKCDPVPCPNK